MDKKLIVAISKYSLAESKGRRFLLVLCAYLTRRHLRAFITRPVAFLASSVLRLPFLLFPLLRLGFFFPFLVFLPPFALFLALGSSFWGRTDRSRSSSGDNQWRSFFGDRFLKAERSSSLRSKPVRTKGFIFLRRENTRRNS